MLMTSDRVRVRVLVVDDDPDHRALMERRLDDAGIAVTSASSGEDALASLDDVDLVLLDYRLPRMSGIDTLRRIRMHSNAPSVIMVTGMGSTDVAVEAMRAGAIDYLTKNPGYLRALPSVVERAWRQHDLARRAGELQRLALIVHSATSREEIVEEIVAGAQRLLRARVAGLALDEGHGLRLEGADGDGDHDLDVVLGLPKDRLPLPGELTVLDRSTLLVALPADLGEAYGVLILVDRASSEDLEEELELASVFAAFAGIALRNLRRRELEESLIAELTQTVEARRDFIASVSHELRTPLTSIGGYAETILGHWEVLDDDRKRQFLTKVRTHAQELGRLVDQLIDIAGLERGQRFRAEMLPLELDVAVASAVDSLELLLVDRVVRTSVPAVTVRADDDLLRRTLVNLISNAVKFSHEGSTIRIEAQRDSAHGYVTVRVADEGVGLSEREAAHVFDPFWRATTSVSNAVRGSGIGLALVREYVRSMQGEVAVQSAPGRGSIFSFTLRLAEPPPGGAGSDRHGAAG